MKGKIYSYFKILIILYSYMLEIPFKNKVDSESVEAKWDKKLKKLKLKISL